MFYFFTVLGENEVCVAEVKLDESVTKKLPFFVTIRKVN